MKSHISLNSLGWSKSQSKKLSKRQFKFNRHARRLFVVAISTLLFLGLSCCTKQKAQRSSRAYVSEAVLLDGFKSPELGTKIYESDNEFKADTVYTKEGYSLVTVEHTYYAQSRYHRLFSPDGKLLMAMSGCQECLLWGYAIIYEDDRVEGIVQTDLFEDAFPDFQDYGYDQTPLALALQEWYNQLKGNEPDFKIIYNSNGDPCEVKGMNNPENTIEGPLEFGIYEGDDFWSSDIHGGVLTFMTFYKDLDEDLNGIGLLYNEKDLCARLIFEKGKVVKYTTYDRAKNILTENDNPEGDIVDRILLEIEFDW